MRSGFLILAILATNVAFADSASTPSYEQILATLKDAGKNLKSKTRLEVVPELEKLLDSKGLVLIEKPKDGDIAEGIRNNTHDRPETQVMNEVDLDYRVCPKTTADEFSTKQGSLDAMYEQATDFAKFYDGIEGGAFTKAAATLQSDPHGDDPAHAYKVLRDIFEQLVKEQTAKFRDRSAARTYTDQAMRVFDKNKEIIDYQSKMDETCPTLNVVYSETKTLPSSADEMWMKMQQRLLLSISKSDQLVGDESNEIYKQKTDRNLDLKSCLPTLPTLSQKYLKPLMIPADRFQLLSDHLNDKEVSQDCRNAFNSGPLEALPNKDRQQQSLDPPELATANAQKTGT